ncbi:neutral/alkaline non-lysosomal ceramidase N-terminal domain-containing protein [Sinomonas terrae]|uniref:Neutral/alkaline non-lysosomal ceramidase N-terminal domain-containing protein n=1 Tax=Sinomonas terrae TaxID=2908838 RepID=A0ABS9U795_9MICC|nr:neutral/alkaline non-lysosomal ceramidase N-terminal domain-containing protein [Sinomonas terrae]MCH6472549.1 hypothetical protein [Sinomonas terrae]
MKAIDFPPCRLRCAASTVDITPPTGIHLHNWAYSRQKTATGVHRPLYASLLALETEAGEGGRSLLVSMDLGWWMSSGDEEALRAAILEACGLSPERVIVALTHTHAGPSLSRADFDRPGGELVAPYLEEIGRSVSSEASRLFEALEPASLDWAYGRCSLAFNRDLYVPHEGRFVVGANPSVEADDTLLVGRLVSPEGRTIAVVVNYAAHPTTLGGTNSLISPDYLGSAREVVEAATGGAFLFLQGASGDLSPRVQYSSDPADADRNGRVLGYAVLSTLEGMLAPGTQLEYAETIESGAPLGVYTAAGVPDDSASSFTRLDVVLSTQSNQPPATEDPVVQADREIRAGRVRSNVAATETVFPVTIWELGRAVVFAYPGEAYSELQKRLRSAAPDRAVVVVNLGNGAHQGYVAPAAAYSDQRYPAWQSPLARGSFERLLSACTEYLATMAFKDRSTV